VKVLGELVGRFKIDGEDSRTRDIAVKLPSTSA
jgi:hypothetical protein